MNSKRKQLRKFIKKHSDQPWNAKCREKTNFDRDGPDENLEYKVTMDDFAAFIDYLMDMDIRLREVERVK